VFVRGESGVAFQEGCKGTGFGIPGKNAARADVVNPGVECKSLLGNGALYEG
jgi:hypothetical protein